MQHAGSDNSIIIVAFAGALRWHKIAAAILVLNYLVFIIGNRITRNGKHYGIKKKDLHPGIRNQIKYFTYGIFRGEKQSYPMTLSNKFNPLQKITYVVVMYIVFPLLVFSGLMLMMPDMTLIKFVGRGIYIFTDIVHIIMGFLILLFLLIHLYTCTIESKSGSLFRGIITGYYGEDE